MKQAYYLVALSFILAGPIGTHAQRGYHHQKAPPADPSPATASPTSTTAVAASSSSSAAAPATDDTLLTADISTTADTTTDDTSTCSGWGIQFKGIQFKGNIDFYWTLQPPWGTKSGKGPFANPLCPGNNSDGGAIFIGTEAKPEGGNTKLECTFNAGQPNCDISLVDGYSVSVACTAPGGQNFGSGIDLWSKTCPDVVGSTCKNANGYAASQSDVAAFFQPAYPDYWIWNSGQNPSNDPTLKEMGVITCTISNGKPSSKKFKREGDEAARVDLKDVMEHVMEPRGVEDLGIAKRHVHRARAHLRGLREMVGALKV